MKELKLEEMIKAKNSYEEAMNKKNTRPREEKEDKQNMNHQSSQESNRGSQKKKGLTFTPRVETL